MGSVFDHATHTFELDFGHEKQTFYSATVILKTTEPYVPDQVQPADYLPAAADEGEEQLPTLGAAAIAALRLDAEN